MVKEKIHTAELYGALESVRYLNMKKYTRKFGAAESQTMKDKSQNILEDLVSESHSKFLMKIFYFIAKKFPSSLQMFSIYVLEKK